MVRVSPAPLQLPSASEGGEAVDGGPPGIAQTRAPGQHQRGYDNVSHDALVFNALSVTPEVFRGFDSESSAGSKSGSSTPISLSEGRLHALRNGHAELGWRLINPFKDKRLLRSLRLLCFHIAMAVLVLSFTAASVCAWTSFAAGAAPPRAEFEAPASAPGGRGAAWRARRELGQLMLSVDVPFFACVGLGHLFSMVMSTAMAPRGCFLVLTAVLQGALVLAGSLVLAFSDPVEMWGAKNSIGFAGAWVMLQNFVGIGALLPALSSGRHEERIVKTRASAARFGVLMLGSAMATSVVYYLVGFMCASGIHPALGLLCLFAFAFLALSTVKCSVQTWLGVPVLACAFWMYWFQVGAYMSFRLLLQAEGDDNLLMLATLAAGFSEICLRIGMVLAAKLMHNYYARKGNAAMALRVLDVQIAAVLVDIWSEWAAIAMAGVLSTFSDDEVFEGLGVHQSLKRFLRTMALQIGVELLSDVASLVAAFAILPISLEGVLKARGHWLFEMSCIIVSLVFVFGTLNMKIRIDCFASSSD